MQRIALFASLATYAVVASQPIFYLVVMTRAQRALSAPAYIELRQQINAVMPHRVPVIYGSALLALLWLGYLSLRVGDNRVVVSVLVSLAALVSDAVLMLRASVPVNSVIDTWTVDDHPADWQVHRDRWFAIFGRRQLVLLVGFASLLSGAALH